MIRIPRCYDSHVHFLGTGQLSAGLRLEALRNSSDLEKLKILPGYFRGEWLVGFGWNEKFWVEQTVISLALLDKLFPDNPVLLVRADGHAAWVNSEALSLARIAADTPDPLGGHIGRDGLGRPNGLLVDSAKQLVDKLLPSFSTVQVRHFAETSLQIFSQAGFTHLRDMSANLQQFQVLHELENQDRLTAYMELNYFCENIDGFSAQLQDLQRASQVRSDKIRNSGIKIFYDGALGSEGALISRCYCGSTRRGLQLWTLEQVEEVFRKTWELGFSVAVHTIGDEAVDQIVRKAYELQEAGIRGQLHLEHVELVRPETRDLMKLVRPTCHMQPSHWLSDRHWLQKSIGDLSEHAFPWRALEDNHIPLFWGSDSPIEKPSLALTENALKESSMAGVPGPQRAWHEFHSHPDPNWGRDCQTLVEDLIPLQTCFDGRIL